MAVGMRVGGVLPLAGVTVAAVALAGVAVFSVSQAGCADPGRYVQQDGYVELVGTCIHPDNLPPPPANPEVKKHEPAEPATHEVDGLIRNAETRP